jgi:hypothetical protein
MNKILFVVITAVASCLVSGFANAESSIATLLIEPSRSSYLVGEPIILKAIFKNAAAKAIEIDLGWNRILGIEASTNEALGVKVRVPKETEGVSRTPVVEIDAAGSYVQFILLDGWLEFEVPGEYLIKIAVTKAHLTAHATVRVVAETPEKLQKHFVELVSLLAFPGDSNEGIVARQALERWKSRDEKLLRKVFPGKPGRTIDDLVEDLRAKNRER